MTDDTLIAQIGTDYAVNIAQKNGMSEGELTNMRLPFDAKILAIVDIKDFISDLEKLGRVKCITRNAYAISIQEGVLTNQYLNGYKKINISAEAGLILNPRDLDLRIFFKNWDYVFFIDQLRNSQQEKSFQVFNKQGVAICKVYVTNESNEDALNFILEKYKCSKQMKAEFEVVKSKVSLDRKKSVGFNKKIDHDWRTMTEVHDFYILASKYKLSRQDMFRSVGDDLAYKVSNSCLNRILLQAIEKNEELTIFIANQGCVQIYTGLVGKFFYKDDWLNIFNKNNKIHISTDKIDECWIVKKPGEFGDVTSLEVFSKDEEQIIQIYGQRDEGKPERNTWRRIVSSVN